MSIAAVAWALLVTLVAVTPLGVSALAFLDAARRPSWAWSLSGRSQVAWMGIIALGVLTVVGGLLISGWYLMRIRPEVAAAESGDIAP
jgi:hypothetical protein